MQPKYTAHILGGYFGVTRGARADAPHCRLICLGITPRHALANSDAQRGGLSVGYTWQLVRFPESFQCKDIHAIDACEVLSMCNLQWP